MIRLLKHLFSTEAGVASFLFSVVVIGTFEYVFHFIGTYVGNHRKALQLLGLNADGSPFEPAPSLPALPPSALPGMTPADRFARDWLHMDYSTTNPTCPMPGFAPPVPPGVAGGLSSLSGKVAKQGQGGERTGMPYPSTASAKQAGGKHLTGKGSEGGGTGGRVGLPDLVQTGRGRAIAAQPSGIKEGAPENAGWQQPG